MAKIRITDLRLRTVIGANDWERDIEQDVIINIKMDFDASPSIQSDNLKDTIDYKTIT
ncbi:MAG: dihydroneopterin aldolase, partial [Candidatus Omnitrophica bacterium]|nr:dihydroneopterin aldolase [Candidatus Omnitrophota bacterium]